MTGSDLADRLERVARRHVMGSIPVDPSGELEAMDLSNVLIVYGNWRNRFVSARPRTVHVSRELAAELSGSPHAHGVTKVSRKIEAGENFDAHLSTGVGVAYVPQAERAAKRHRARDLDAMLAERGLHHLHLGADEGSRFVARTTELLFVAFRDDDAYLVGTFPHGAWARREVLERMVRNWPDAELLMQARGVIGLEQDYSDEDRLKLMLGGVSTAIEIDGSVYMGLGQTTAGTPMQVTMRVNALMWELTYLREHGVAARVRNRGANPSLYWTPAVRDEHCGLLSSQGFLALGRLS